MTLPFNLNILLFDPDDDTFKLADLGYTIRYDSKLHEIQEKIFTSNELDPDYPYFLPRFQRLFFKTEQGFDFNLIPIVTNETSGMSSLKNQVVMEMIVADITKTGFIPNNEIYMESLLQRILNNFSEFRIIFSELHTTDKSPDVQEQLQELSIDYPLIDETFLQFAIFMVANLNSELEPLDLLEELNYQRDKESFLSQLENFKKKLNEDYQMFDEINLKQENDLSRIPINSENDLIINDITEKYKNGIYKSGILNILLEFEGPFDSNNNHFEFIDLHILFDQMEASDDIPFISIGNKEPKGTPFMKIYEKMIEKKNIIDKWILIEKDTPSGLKRTMKAPQGLTFRIKMGNNYNLVNIFKDGKIRFRLSWSENEKATLENVKESIEILKKYIKTLNKKRIAFKEKYTIPSPSFESSIIQTIDSALLIKLTINKEDVYYTIESESALKNFFSFAEQQKKKEQLCEDLGIPKRICDRTSKTELIAKAKKNNISLVTDSVSKEQVNLIYNKVSKRIKEVYKKRSKIDLTQPTVETQSDDLEDSSEKIDTRVLLTIKNSAEFDNHIIFLVKNTKTIALANIIFDMGLSLLKMTFKKDDLLQSIPSIKKNVPLKKINLFKQLGIPYNARKCQQKKQPEVDGKPQKGSYSIIINGYNLTCQNPEFPYPGFQNDGIPCCFKTNQKDKTVFKKYNNIKEFKEETDDVKLDLGNVITKNKLLLPGKRGLLFGEIGKFFELVKGKNEEFNRIGVYQEEFPFLNVIYEVIKSVMKFESFKSFKNELENFLNYGTYLKPRSANITDIHKNETTDIKYKGELVSIYESLGNGLISRQLKQSEYITEIINGKKSDHTLLLDLLTKFTRMNIFIFSEKFQNILCYSDYYDTLDSWEISNGPSIILLKYGEYYEPIYLIRGSKVTKIYSAESIVSKMIKKVYSYSCNVTPSKQTFFSEALTARKTFDLLKLKGFDAKAQLITAFNETVFLVINNSILIPVKPSGPIEDLKISKKIKKKDIEDLRIRTAQELIKIYSNLSQQLGINLKVKQQVVENGKVTSVILENGFAVPTKESEYIQGIPISKINFALDIDNVIRSGLKLTDERVILAEKINTYKGVKLQTRYELSKYLQRSKNKEILKRLKKLVESSKKSEEEKNQEIYEIISDIIPTLSVKVKRITAVDKVLKQEFRSKGLCKVTEEDNEVKTVRCSENPFCAISNFKCKVAIPKKYYPNLVESIAKEISQDINYKEILSGKVILDSDVGEFIKRPGEVIITDIDSAVRWLTSNKTN